MKEIKNSLIDIDNGIYKIDTDRTMSILENVLNGEFNGEIKDAILEAKDTLEIMITWHNDCVRRLNEYYFGTNKCGNCKDKTIIDHIIYNIASKQHKK